MCGLLFSTIAYNKDEFKKALSTMEYRGPDVPLNYYEHNEFRLGHNRLSILDTQHGNQPYFSEDRRYVIVYNGI